MELGSIREGYELLRTPVRLFQFPGVAVAVVAAAFVLALTATSGRLFIGAAGDAALEQELGRVGGVPALAMVMFGNERSDIEVVQGAAELVASRDAPELGPPVRTRSGPTLELVAGSRTTQVRLAARDGAGAHIEVLERAAGDGAWLPDTAARSLGVAAGQTVHLGGPAGVPVRVAGVYRDLGAGHRPLDPFWSPLSSVIYTTSAARDTPPPLLLVDPDRFVELSIRLDTPSRLEWDFYPEPGRLTLPRADLLVAEIQAVQRATGDAFVEPGSGLGRVTTSSPIDNVVRRAHTTVAALTGPVESMSLTGRHCCIGCDRARA